MLLDKKKTRQTYIYNGKDRQEVNRHLAEASSSFVDRKSPSSMSRETDIPLVGSREPFAEPIHTRRTVANFAIHGNGHANELTAKKKN